jgi:hypothetical protein
MSSYRSFFGYIIATATICIMSAMTISTGTASAYDRDPGWHRITVSYDVMLPVMALRPEAPALAERREIPTIDPSSRLFASLDRPGQSWRTAADVYRHIDPGRRLAI